MYRQYILPALRQLARNKIYSVINIAGLSLGLAAVLELREAASPRFGSFPTFA